MDYDLQEDSTCTKAMWWKCVLFSGTFRIWSFNLCHHSNAIACFISLWFLVFFFLFCLLFVFVLYFQFLPPEKRISEFLNKLVCHIPQLGRHWHKLSHRIVLIDHLRQEKIKNSKLLHSEYEFLNNIVISSINLKFWQ